MQVVADIVSSRILNTIPTPDEGGVVVCNGKYLFPIPEGASVEITDATYILPQNAGSLTAQCAESLLIRYPMYSNILYNALVEPSDLLAFDLNTSNNPFGLINRAFTGRALGPAPTGISPNTVCVLNQNNAASPSRPGCLTTDVITTIPGADDVMLWYAIAEIDTTEDVNHGFGTTSGVNIPAFRNLIRCDQDPPGFQAYVSNDGGSTWVEADRLVPADLVVFGDTRATAGMTVTTSPSTATITIAGQTLTPTAGPRTSGANDYNAIAGSPAGIAADIIAAINDPNNAFRFNRCTAVSGGGATINLTSVLLGALGNALGLSSSDGTITVSGVTFTGGLNADFRVSWVNTSNTRYYLLAYALLW
jgi:hypothetical protein